MRNYLAQAKTSQKKYSHKALAHATLIAWFLILISGNVLGSEDKPSILVLGDSLSAAYGIQVQEGWVSLLQRRFKDKLVVHNASISGETTDGGLQSLPRHLNNHEPDIVILELGANDGLRGFPVELIKQNLLNMIKLAKEKGAQVLLLGMHIPPNYGSTYTTAFFSNYANLAEQTGTALVPFLLEEVALKPEMMQDDGLHPTAEAQPIILETILRALKPMLENT